MTTTLEALNRIESTSAHQVCPHGFLPLEVLNLMLVLRCEARQRCEILQ